MTDAGTQSGWVFPDKDGYFLILVDAADVDELNAIHEIVKAHSVTWWHQMEFVWIVRGHSPHYWNRLVAPVMAMNPASGSLVIPLPKGAPPVAFKGPGYLAKMEWLKSQGVFDWTAVPLEPSGQIGPPLSDDDIPF